MPPATHKAQPPLPAPVFCVGVTGHRPERLQDIQEEVLLARVYQVLRTMAEAARAAAPKVELRLFSSLAEGTDRIAVHAALDTTAAGPALGYKLVTLLPMPAAQFEEDFKMAASVQQFRELLARGSVYSLPSPGADRESAYVAASQIVMAQADVLLAIWDGGPPNGKGGTPDNIARAAEQYLPMVIIDAHGEGAIRMGPGSNAGDTMEKVVERVLKPADTLSRQIASYRAERWPGRPPTGAYTTLRVFAEGKFKTTLRPDINKLPTDVALPALRPYFQWTDTLALYFGERSRSAALRLQLLATTSVIAALVNIPLTNHVKTSRVLSLTEVLAITWLLVGVWHSRHGCWHGRWLRYRAAAEQLRCVDLLAPLMLTMRQVTEVASFEQTTDTTLVPWLIRSIERSLAVVPTTVDDAFLTAQLDRVRRVIDAQAAFHQRTALRYKNAEAAFHRVGVLLFVLAALLGLYDLVHAFAWMPACVGDLLERHPAVEVSISTLAAVLPALGAAAAATVAQGEYKRLAERYEGAENSLGRLKRKLPTKDKIPTLQETVNATVGLVSVLAGEVRDWSVMLAARPPSVPL